MFNSEKAVEIINKQNPMDTAVIERVKYNLAEKGIILDQSKDIDNYLISQGKEAATYSDGTIIAHTKVSASGFYEELIHYGQIKSGRTVINDESNNYLMEIEAKERLIKYQKAYKIADYEIDILKEVLNEYTIKLENLKRGGV
jgi:hypothetical protein